LASVLPTTSDIKFPTKSAFGTAAAKAETSSFGGTQPTLGQFTLSAFMGGVAGDVSWELVQDVPAFQQFAVQDMLDAMTMYEENLFINGTGTGQAQGLINNIGAGITAEPDSNGNLVTIAGTLDLIGSLNALYHKGASWLMTRATSIIIRKAQTQSNLFVPAWVSVGGTDYLHGYPVEYSAYVPAAARGAAPVVFGDFKRGYVIGDRGGSGINVKVLDQPKAVQGLITLLAYRRMDGRVRRSEALQTYVVAAS
jgi:HK97 family phage major capsid protein